MKEKFSSEYALIGKNIREYRERAGLSQEQLASRCTVNAAKISKMENGRVDYLISSLMEVAEALGVKLEKLLATD